ncbi:MAG: dephospho-CoA kinase [Clostridia bacterium]|nr:dephospho-CoA kinase [Clostridia bacterium]
MAAQQKMLTIGLTGPTGAGKGEVARILDVLGVPVLDADRIYHELLLPPSPCLDAIVAAFGTSVLAQDGTLLRPALRRIVFSDKSALATLNRISHRFVMEEVRARLAELEQRGARAAVLDAPQLFEAGADADCHAVIAVLAPTELRARRIMERDRIDASTAISRILAQKSDDFFRTHADTVIENTGDLEDLKKATLAAWKQLTEGRL